MTQQQASSPMAPTPDVLHDSELVRRAAQLVRTDRQRLLPWQARTMTTALVNQWISAGLCERSTGLVTQAQALRERARLLRRQSRALFRRPRPDGAGVSSVACADC